MIRLAYEFTVPNPARKKYSTSRYCRAMGANAWGLAWAIREKEKAPNPIENRMEAAREHLKGSGEGGSIIDAKLPTIFQRLRP
jgi:hypothetical protein